MTTKEELFAAVKTVRDYCKDRLVCSDRFDGDTCPLWSFCGSAEMIGNDAPCDWPDPDGGRG